MEKYFFISLLKRVLSSTIILFLIITLLFFLLRSAPGNPAQKYLNPELSQALNEKISQSFKLDGSATEQYISFITNFVSGDFGISYSYRIPVVDVLKTYLPFTTIFAFSSICFQLLISFILFALTVKFKAKVFDKLLSGSLIILYLIPSYLLGVFLIYIFSVKLSLLPSSGLSSITNSGTGVVDDLFDYIKHLILPLITVSASGIPVFYKYIKDSYNSILSKKYIINLKASGYKESTIAIRHILPNIAGVITSVTAIELGTLLGGALLTEVIFGLPGMGRLAYSAVLSRDYPLITGCSFAAAFFVVLCNLLADVIKSLIDKRFIKGGMLN